MADQVEDPAARAGADRVEVIKLAGQIDFPNRTVSSRHFQVQRLLTRYAISAQVATFIAEYAFGPGSDQ